MNDLSTVTTDELLHALAERCEKMLFLGFPLANKAESGKMKVLPFWKSENELEVMGMADLFKDFAMKKSWDPPVREG